MITKSLRPMPEKFKGLTDIEARYRQRYLDLMTNSSTKEVFVKRTKIIDSMRKKMNEVGMMIDVSHVSDDTFLDIMMITNKPVIASHSSPRVFTPGFKRNLNDRFFFIFDRRCQR